MILTCAGLNPPPHRLSAQKRTGPLAKLCQNWLWPSTVYSRGQPHSLDSTPNYARGECWFACCTHRCGCGQFCYRIFPSHCCTMKAWNLALSSCQAGSYPDHEYQASRLGTETGFWNIVWKILHITLWLYSCLWSHRQRASAFLIMQLQSLTTQALGSHPEHLTSHAARLLCIAIECQWGTCTLYDAITTCLL